MRTLEKDSSEGEKNVRIFVRWTSELQEALKKMVETLTNPLPWVHYGDPACPMRRRSYVAEKSGGLIRYPSKNSFSSTAEAHVMLACGIALEYRQAPLKVPRHQWPGTEKSEFYLGQQLRALNRLFNSRASKFTKDQWWPIVLNQRADLLSIRCPASEIGLDVNLGLSKMLLVHRSFEWSREQQAALSEIQEFKGPVQILQGPPGSGKTQVLAGKALFFALLGFSVLVVAQTAPVAKAFALCIRKLLESSASKDQMRDLQVTELFPFAPLYEDMKTQGPVPDLRNVKILITTPNFVSSKVCCTHFGAKAPGIVVIHEDSCMIPDPELLATIFSLEHYEKVTGIILSTDIREWPMDLATLTDPIRQIKRQGEKRKESLYFLFFLHFYKNSKNKHYNPEGIKKSGDLSFLYGRNEFADQLGLALVTRLIRQNFPSTRLEEQHRLCRSLIAFPSSRAYDCESFSHERALGRGPSVARFTSVVRDWLGSKVPEELTKLFVSTDNPKEGIHSECQKARKQSESKSNT
jgi:AAA domain